MSALSVDPVRITAVLCHDGWHDVVPGTFGFSFEEPVERQNPLALPDLHWGPIGVVYAIRVTDVLDTPEALLDTGAAPNARIYRDLTLYARPAP